MFGVMYSFVECSMTLLFCKIERSILEIRLLDKNVFSSCRHHTEIVNLFESEKINRINAQTEASKGKFIFITFRRMMTFSIVI